MVRSICKWLVFKLMYPICYFLSRLQPVKYKKIVFVENHADQLSDNFILLKKAFELKNYDISVHYLSVSSSGWGEIVLKSLRLIWDMGSARCVFLNESNSLFGAFTIRKETKLIQVWHACGAFKKWGFSVADKTFGDNQRELEKFPGHRNYNLVPVSGEAVCWAYEEAFGLKDKPGVVQALGVSRTDVYYDKDRIRQAYNRLRKLHFPMRGRKIILYAPTFRGDIRTAKAPAGLDFSKLSVLKDEYVVFLKQHPFVKEAVKIPENCGDFCFEITNELSTEELIMVSDICITDYSSVVFEYTLLKKPILFFAYDLEEYYDERGFYYPYEEFVPGPIVRTTEELIMEITRIDQYDLNRVEDFHKKYMSGCDGHATERIVQYALS